MMMYVPDRVRDIIFDEILNTVDYIRAFWRCELTREALNDAVQTAEAVML